jgi:four helix bundle protein
MGKITRFEDIEAWKKARELVGNIYEITNNGRFLKDYGLRDQIRRAAISVMLNIAEGFARRTDKEFGQFLFIAHGSLAEIQSALYIALDQKYIDDGSCRQIYEQCDEVSRMLSGFITYLRG